MCEQRTNLHLRKCIWNSRTSTILFLLQYVNIIRNATQPFSPLSLERHTVAWNWWTMGHVMAWFLMATAHCLILHWSNVYWWLSSLIIHLFIYSLISVLRDTTLIQCVLISIIPGGGGGGGGNCWKLDPKRSRQKWDLGPKRSDSGWIGTPKDRFGVGGWE